MEEDQKKDLCHIGHCVGKLQPKSPVGNKGGVKKLAIGTRTDSNGNNPDMVNETTVQIYRVGIHQMKPQQPRK